jgi:phosphatidate cytidylyltransferase
MEGGRQPRVRRRRSPQGDEPEPLASPRRVRISGETVRRILVAIPWIVFAIVIIVVGSTFFALALIGLGVIGLTEFFTMTQRAHPITAAGFVTMAGLVIAARYGSTYQILLVGMAGIPLMFAIAAARPSHENITFSMATTVFGVVWIGLPLAHAVLLRDLPLHGGALVVDVLVGTFIADTAAYGGGRLFGSHKITPRISPNKTLEGLVCGFVGGTMAFWFAGLYQDWLSGADALIMGAAIAALAPIGDLFASLIKRDLDVKDTGSIFGPHGGLIDRLDALFFTVVAGYYLAVVLVY